MNRVLRSAFITDFHCCFGSKVDLSNSEYLYGTFSQSDMRYIEDDDGIKVPYTLTLLRFWVIRYRDFNDKTLCSTIDSICERLEEFYEFMNKFHRNAQDKLSKVEQSHVYQQRLKYTMSPLDLYVASKL